MSKKANYFSHDSNARTDEKILAVRIKYGAEGYGIYFMILENLREQSTYSCIKDYNLLAFDLRVDALKVKSIVEDFGLFSFTDDGKRFYSESFNHRMVIKDEKSDKAREKAFKRWEKKPMHTKTDATAMQQHTKTDASKVKESKVKESNTPPPKKDLHVSMPKYPENCFDLKPNEIQNSIEFIFRLKRKNLTAVRINEMWRAFELSNFSGEKYYKSRSDIMHHFMNWLKNQDLEESKIEAHRSTAPPLTRA